MAQSLLMTMYHHQSKQKKNNTISKGSPMAIDVHRWHKDDKKSTRWQEVHKMARCPYRWQKVHKDGKKSKKMT